MRTRWRGERLGSEPRLRPERLRSERLKSERLTLVREDCRQ